jgi:hypothetical protein
LIFRERVPRQLAGLQFVHLAAQKFVARFPQRVSGVTLLARGSAGVQIIALFVAQINGLLCRCFHVINGSDLAPCLVPQRPK